MRAPSEEIAISSIEAGGTKAAAGSPSVATDRAKANVATSTAAKIGLRPVWAMFNFMKASYASEDFFKAYAANEQIKAI